MQSALSDDARRERVALLREALRARQNGVGDAVGDAERDAILPERGFRRGTLVEWNADAPGSGAKTFAFAAACGEVEEGGTLVVVDSARTFYPSAAAAFGLSPTSLLLVRPSNEREALWAFDQALRCPAVSVVWGPAASLPGRAYRRLQLSAEEGGTLGFLLRSTRTVGQPAWCDLAFVVRSLPTGKDPRYRVEIVRSRDGRTGRSAEFELDRDGTIRRTSDSDGTPALRLVPPLVDPATARRDDRRRTDRPA